jgi:hypothetical protein
VKKTVNFSRSHKKSLLSPYRVQRFYFFFKKKKITCKPHFLIFYYFTTLCVKKKKKKNYGFRFHTYTHTNTHTHTTQRESIKRIKGYTSFPSLLNFLTPRRGFKLKSDPPLCFYLTIQHLMQHLTLNSDSHLVTDTRILFKGQGITELPIDHLPPNKQSSTLPKLLCYRRLNEF